MLGARVGLAAAAHVELSAGVGLDELLGATAAAPSSTTLSVVLADSADPVTGGTNFNYTIVVANVGSVDATSVSAVLTLDPTLTFSSGSGSGWSVVNVSGVVTCTRATLAVGTAPTITVTVTSTNATSTESSTVDASAANATLVSDTETTSVVGQTTLTVAINDSADPVNGGANFNYTVVVTNSGSNDATTVAAVVTLDSSLTYVSASGTGWSVGRVGQVVTCTRATLAAGAAPTITVTVTSANATSTTSTTADADADNTPNATQDTETTSIVAQTTLTVAINDSADPVISVVNFNYTVVVTNSGANSATNVTAVVVLDSSLTYVSGSGTGWSVGQSGQTVTCTRASLAVGAAPTITITVTSANAASTASTTADADADNTPNATQDVETTVVKLVARDATSGIRCPATATQFSDLCTYAGLTISPATYVWGCQDASGNLAEGGGGPVLTANATPSYSNAISGWTRVAVGFTDGTAAQRFRSTDTSLPDISTTAAFLLAYFAAPSTPAGVRGVLELGATQAEARITTNPFYRNVAGGVTTTGSGAISTGVRPVGLVMRPVLDTSGVYTDQEKIETAAVTTPTGKLVGVGATGGVSAPPGRCLYLALIVDDPTAAEIKALYQALGWTIPWS